MIARRSILTALAAGALLVGACGDDEEEPVDSGTAPAEKTTDDGSAATAGAPTADDQGGEVLSGKVTLNISNFSFVEEDVTVESGTTVTWKNADDAIHTATAKDGSFDTGDIPGGGSGEATLDEPGTYSYFCEPHPFMTASITVE